MKNWKRIALIAAVTALSTLLIISVAAFAQGNGPANRAAAGNCHAYGYGNGTACLGQGYGLAARGAWGGPGNSLVAAAAEVIGIEQAELVAELADGPQSIADVAAAHNVAVQDIVDAYLALRGDMLAQAVADGRLTQAQADAMLATMEAQVSAQVSEPWTPRGNGSCDGTCTGPNWSGADGDGTCDHYPGMPYTMHGGWGSGMMGGMGGRWNQ